MGEDLTWYEVCDADELDVEDVIGFEAGGNQYAVYRTPSGYYATDGRCTHEGALLAEGMVTGEIIECPLHQANFHIPTGEAKSAPASVNLKTYPVKIEDGKVYIGLKD
jgi:3-phenylpropionate/trans-cinnamate dioxygenase ferredoxin subunit